MILKVAIIESVFRCEVTFEYEVVLIKKEEEKKKAYHFLCTERSNF